MARGRMRLLLLRIPTERISLLESRQRGLCALTTGAAKGSEGLRYSLVRTPGWSPTSDDPHHRQRMGDRRWAGRNCVYWRGRSLAAVSQTADGRRARADAAPIPGAVRT